MANSYYSGAPAANFDGTRFFNPGEPTTAFRLRRAASGGPRAVRDTGYGNGRIFRLMRQEYGAADVALIPIGAYDPRWFMSAQHCNPEEAVEIMLDVGARRAIGIHWGTFKLTDEPRDEPCARLASALLERGIDFEKFVAGHPGDVWDAATGAGWS